MKWYCFRDNWSGGSRKTEWDEIWIQAEDKVRAADVFEARTETNAYWEACECCGSNFDITEHEAVQELYVNHTQLIIEART